MIPDWLLELYRVEATYNTNWQAWVHRSKEHEKRRHSSDGPCWWCGRALATCKSKRRHDTWESAQEHADNLNDRFDGIYSKPYQCIWSEGLHWHVGKTVGASQRRRARKRMARLRRVD